MGCHTDGKMAVHEGELFVAFQEAVEQLGDAEQLHLLRIYTFTF